MNSKTIMEDYSTFYIKYVKEKGNDDAETIKTFVYAGERNKEGSQYKDIKEIKDDDIIIRAIIANKIVGEATSIVQANSKLNAAADKAGSKEPRKNIRLNIEIDNLIKTYGLSGDFTDIQGQVIQRILSSGGAFSETYPDITTKESKYKLFLGPNKDLGLAILRYFARKQGFDIENFNVTDDPTNSRITIGYTKGPLNKERPQPRQYQPSDNDPQPKSADKAAAQADHQGTKPDDAADIIDKLNERKGFVAKIMESLNETARKVKAAFTGEKDGKDKEPGAPTRTSESRETTAAKLLEQLMEAHNAGNKPRATVILRTLENMAGFDISRVPEDIRALYTTKKTQPGAQEPKEAEPTPKPEPQAIPSAITFHNEQIRDAASDDLKMYWVERRLALPEFQDFLKSVNERLQIALQNEDQASIESCLRTINDAHTGKYELPSVAEVRDKMIQAELAQDKETYDICLKTMMVLSKITPSLGDGSDKTL